VAAAAAATAGALAAELQRRLHKGEQEGAAERERAALLGGDLTRARAQVHLPTTVL
jgi:hypothetical protein